VQPVQGRPGVTVAGSPFRFVALQAGRDTKLERIRRVNGSIDATTVVRGSFGIPGAAYDGSDTGLSADGRTLVLATFWTRRPQTTLAVLNAVQMGARYMITLPGFFTVDAVSPTGRWLYLIEYRSPNNPLNYKVRAYDLAHRQLLARPVVDPREPDEKMVGMPITRVVGPGGRWVYTLYSGNKSFVHALDTQTRRAFCIDVPPVDPTSARLALGPGPALRVTVGGLYIALIDTRTMTVREPAAPAPHAPPARHTAGPAARGGTGDVALQLGLGIVALAAGAAGVIAIAARRRRQSPDARDALADAS
jgi:hypothetical protein